MVQYLGRRSGFTYAVRAGLQRLDPYGSVHRGDNLWSGLCRKINEDVTRLEGLGYTPGIHDDGKILVIALDLG